MRTGTRPPRIPRSGRRGLSWLTPVGQLLADQAERSRQPAQSIILLWLGGGPSQLETFDPHPDTRIAAGTKAIATAVRGIQLARGLRATGRPDGLGRLDPIDGEQGGRPRARNVFDEDRLSARSDGRAPLDRRDLLPRAAGGPDRHSPAHLDPDRPVAEPGRVSRAASSTRSRSAIRRANLPDVTPAVAGPRESARVERPGGRRASLRPRPRGRVRGHPASRDARPRPRDDDLRAAQGVRRLARAGERPCRVRRHARSAAAAWPPAG